MPVNGYDFLINGVGYNAAEDAEGDHYVLNGEPLRPPNAVTVQGENSQKFQVRPDILLWSVTDWSGGEGQQKYSAQAPNKMRELEGVRVFDKPGTIRPGYFIEATQDSTGAADLAVAGQLAIGDEQLVLIEDSDTVYVWAATKWGAAVTLTGPAGAGTSRRVAGDFSNIYFAEDSTDDVFYWPVTGTTATNLNADSLATSFWALEALGPYVYALSVALGEVWEIPKDGSAEVQIDDFELGTDYRGHITSSGGKVYVSVVDAVRTAVREITPSSAAGTGFGAEIASLPGFTATAMWAHSGMLFFAGYSGTDDSNFSVMYLSLDGTYGSLGRLRPGTFIGTNAQSEFNGTMLNHYFALTDATSDITRLFEIDAISGGIACLGYTSDDDLATITSMAVFGEDIFISGTTDASEATLRARADQFTVSSYAITPWHDFDLADEKLLASLTLSCEALLADWTLYVDYAIDGSSSWTNVITYSTDNGKGVKTAVSTDSSTIKFRTLSLRLRMVYGGAGVPTTAPVVLGIEARAMVVQHVNTWQLLLNLSDDKSGPQGFSGARKTTNILTSAATKNVIAFKDGYRDSTPGVVSEYDVVIDSYVLLMSTPGEGIARVELKEIT